MLGKHSLKPGEQVELNVSYDTEGRPGPFEKKVIITTNISGKELEILTIKGTVNEAPSPIIAATPRRITITGNDRRDGKKKESLAIKNEGALPLIITGIRSRDGQNVYFNGTGKEAITIEPEQTKTVEIQLGGNAGNASEREYIVIECNARNAGDSGYFIIIQYE